MHDFIKVTVKARPVGIRQRSLVKRCRLGRATELVMVLVTGATISLGGAAVADNLFWDPAGGGAVPGSSGVGIWAEGPIELNWYNATLDAPNDFFEAGDDVTFGAGNSTVTVDFGDVNPNDVTVVDSVVAVEFLFARARIGGVLNVVNPDDAIRFNFAPVGSDLAIIGAGDVRVVGVDGALTQGTTGTVEAVFGTISGLVDVNAGTFVANGVTMASGFDVADGATLEVFAESQIDAASVNAGTLDVNANILGGQTITNTGTATLAANITGSYAQGAGDTTVDGDTAVSGTVAINGGTLTITDTFTLTAGGVRVGETGAATIEVNGTLDSALQVDAGSNAVLRGDVTGTVTNAGSLTTAGTTTISSDSDFGANYENTGTVNIAVGQTLSAQSITNTSGTINLLGVGSTLQGTGNTLNNDAAIVVEDGGTVTDAGAINNLDTGTITFNGNGTFNAGDDITNDGAITVNAGAGTVGVGSDALVNQGTGTIAVNSGTMNGITTLTNNSTSAMAITLAPGTTLGFDSLQSSAGTITSAGLLDGNVSLSDAAVLNQNDGGSVDGNLDVNGTSTVDISGTSGDGTIEVTGRFTHTSSGTSTLAGDIGDLNLTGGTVDVDGDVVNSGLSFIDGTGTLRVLAGNTYTAAGGDVQVGFSGASGTLDVQDTAQVVGNVNIRNAGVLSMAGATNGTDEITGNVTFQDNSTANSTIAGDIGGAVQIVAGSTATVTTEFATTIGGVLNIDDGTFVTNAATTLGSGFDVADGGTLQIDAATTLDAASTNAGILDVNADILGGETITNTGSMTLAGAVTGNLVQNTSDTASTVVDGASSISGSVEIATGSLTLDSTLTAGSLAGAGGLVLNDTLTTGGNDATTTFSGAASGAGGITKQGAGTFTLSGANTYSGDTTISGGVLQVGDGGTTGTLGSGAVVNDATLRFNRSNLTVVGNAISGTGALSTVGTGVTVLTGTNSYAGTTTIAADGVLQVGSNGTTGTLGTGAVINDGSLNFFRSDDLTVANAISGTGTVGKVGAGTTTLSATNTYTGMTTVNAGTLNVTGSIAGDVTVDVAGRLRIGNSDAIGGAITATGSVISYADGVTEASAVVLNSDTAQLEVLTGESAEQSGVISESGGARPLEKIGDGTLTLSGANTYTGATTVSAGTLDVTGSVASTVIAVNNNGVLRVDGASLLDTAAVTLSGTGDLTLTGAETIGSLASASGTSTVTLDADLTTGDGTDTEFSGVAAGAGGLTKQGAGTFTLSGANTYTGTTTINAGTLVAANDTALGTTAGGTVVADGARLGLTGGITTGEAITLNGTGGGQGALRNVLGDNTATGQITLATDATVVVAEPGDLLTLSGGVTGTDTNLTVDGSGDVEVSGDITTEAGDLIKNGIGTLTLSGDGNTHTGANTVNEGILRVGAGGAAGTLGSGLGDVTINTPGELRFDRDATTDLDVANVIVGDGTVRQSGSGTTILSGTSTDFTGTAEVDAGILRVTGSFGDATASAATVNVNTGGTLQGTGTIRGTVNVDDGGTLAAGASFLPFDTGTLTIEGDLVLDGDSSSDFELNASNSFSLGLFENDRVDVQQSLTLNGDLTLGGTLNVSSASDSLELGYYRLFDYDGALLGGTLNIGALPTDLFDVASVDVLTNVDTQVNLRVLGFGPATQFWDGAGAYGDGDVAGGDGTWEAGEPNWAIFNGDFNDEWLDGYAVFGATAGTVTVSGTQDFTGLQFDTDGYALTGGTLNTIADGFDLTPDIAEILVQTDVTAIIQSEISGTDMAVEKTGLGRLVLDGNTHTFTGDMFVREGTLELTGDVTLQETTTVEVANGATLDVADAQAATIGALSSTDTAAATSMATVVLNGSGVLAINGNTDTVYAGVLDGMGILRNIGSGGLELTGDGSTMTGTILATGDDSLIDITGTGTVGATVVGAGPLVGAGPVATFRTDGGALLASNSILVADGQVTFTGSETVGTVTDFGISGLSGGTVTLTTLAGTPNPPDTVLTVTGEANALNPSDFNGINGTVDGNGTLNITGGTFTVGATGDVQTATTIGSSGTVINDGDMGGVGNEGNFTNNNTVGGVGNGGGFTNNGTAGGVRNTGVFTNNGGAGAVTNSDSGTGTNTDGAVIANLTNEGDATFDNVGDITGNVFNTATFDHDGTVGGNLTQSAGNTTLAGSVGVNLVQSGGTTVVDGPASVAGTTSVSGGSFTVNTGNVLTATGGLSTSGTGTVDLNGTVTGAVTQGSSGTSTLAGAISGALNIDAGALTVDGASTVGGAMTNTGRTVTVDADLTVAQVLTNTGIIDVASGATLSAATIANNDGSINLLGTGSVLQGTGNTLNNDAAIAVADGGTITDAGAINNLAGGTITFNGNATFDADDNNDSGGAAFITNEGRITVQSGAGNTVAVGNDALANLGTALLDIRSGTMNGLTILTNEAGGTVSSTPHDFDAQGGIRILSGGTLGTNTLINSGVIGLQTESTLTVAQVLTNTGTIDVASGATLSAATVANDGGSINLLGAGSTLRGTGNTLNNAAAIVVADGGTITDAGAINNLGDGTIIFNGNATFDADDNNDSGGAAFITNRGTITVQSGAGNTVAVGNDALANLGTALLDIRSGTMSGLTILTNEAGGPPVLTDDGTPYVHDFDTRGGIRVLSGATLGTDRVINSGVIGMQTDSSLIATALLENRGYLKAEGNTTITGNVRNTGTIDLWNGNTGDVLSIGGDAVLNGRIRMDVNLSGQNVAGGAADTSDTIRVGGSISGDPVFDLNNVGRENFFTRLGSDLTLLEYDGANNLAGFTVEGVQTSGALIFRLADTGGALRLQSDANPALGGIASGVSAMQGLISTVVNRPSSAFVTPLVDPGDDPCSIGNWARASGGQASASLDTDSGGQTITNDIDMNYYGIQVGLDRSCSGGYYNGWDLAFGAMVGANVGNSSVPVFRFNPNTNLIDTNSTASEVETDFQQFFGGVYVNAARGNFFGDLQLRFDRTSYDLSETTSFENGGLGIADQTYDSTGMTFSGSVSYSHLLNESLNLRFVPTVGFSVSRIQIDDIEIAGDPDNVADDATFELDDITQQIGLIGASLARTQVLSGGRSAVTYFGTATYFNDFGDDISSTLRFAGVEQDVTSDNLGGFGEVSVGMNFTGLFETGSILPTRQLDASVRADARYGDKLESWGVTAQVRLQF